MAKHSERVTRQHHKALAAADVEHGNDHQQIPTLEGKWFAALRILSLFVDPEAPPPLSGNVEFIAKVAHSIFADSLRIHECGVYRHSGLSCVHQDVFSTDMVDEASRVLSLTCKMFRVLSMKKAALTIQVAFDTLYRYGEKRRNARFFPIGVWGKGKGYEAEKGWAHIYFDRLTEYAAYFHDHVDVKNRLMPRILMRYCSTPKPEPDRHNSYFACDVEDTPPAAKRTKTAHSATAEPRSATGLNSTRQTQHTKEDLAKSVRETRKRTLEEEQTPADSVDDVPAWNPHERIDQDQAAIWQALKATGTTDPSLDWAKVPKTRPFSPVRDMAKHSERVTRQHHKALAAADVEHGNDHQQIPTLEGKWFAALRILSLFVDPEAPPPLSGNVEFIAKVAHSIFADSLRIHECGVYRHSGLSCVHQDVFSTDMVDEASRVLSLTCKMFRVLSMKKAALTIQVAFDTLYRYGEKRRNARFFPIGVWGKGKGYEAEKGWAHIYFDRLTEYAAYFHDHVDVKNRLMPRILMRYCSTPKPEPDRHNSYFACDGAVFHCQPRRQAGQPGLHSLKDPEQIRHADVYMSLAPSLHAGLKNHSEKYYRDRMYDFLSMVFSGERTSPYAFTTWRAYLCLVVLQAHPLGKMLVL